jgi:hypothetical protein
MVITILAEPRSGSTNLANWFALNKNFTVLFEPITCSECDWYKHGTPPKSWRYIKPHLLVKEIYRPGIDFSELIEISDKLIILYRKNIIEQTESWLNAVKTNSWHKQWVFKEELIQNRDTTFNEIKDGIKKEYLDKDYFNISYEELYYNGGFQKIVDYLELECVKNENFPVGEKYRINIDGVRNLI